MFEWFRTTAAMLNDDHPTTPFRRYALKDLVAFYNDALCLLAKHRPDMFTDTKNVELTCGSMQDTRGCCDNVVDVVAQVDEHGNVLKELSTSKKTDTKVKTVWNKPSCIGRNPNDPNAYVIDGAVINNHLNGRFSVTPPVPRGAKVYAMVLCTRQPCPLTEADVLADEGKPAADCGYLAVVRYYVLAMALSGDRHSNSAQADAQRFFSMWWSVLGVLEGQEKKFEEAAQ